MNSVENQNPLLCSNAKPVSAKMNFGWKFCNMAINARSENNTHNGHVWDVINNLNGLLVGFHDVELLFIV